MVENRQMVEEWFKVNNVISFNGGSMKVTWKLRGPGRREPVGRPGRLHGRGCGAPPASHRQRTA